MVAAQNGGHPAALHVPPYLSCWSWLQPAAGGPGPGPGPRRGGGAAGAVAGPNVGAEARRGRPPPGASSVLLTAFGPCKRAGRGGLG